MASTDNGLTTSRSLQTTIHWLLLGILQSQQRIKESRQPQQEYSSIIEKASGAIQKIIELPTVQALLYVAMSDDVGKLSIGQIWIIRAPTKSGGRLIVITPLFVHPVQTCVRAVTFLSFDEGF